MLRAIFDNTFVHSAVEKGYIFGLLNIFCKHLKKQTNENYNFTGNESCSKRGVVWWRSGLVWWRGGVVWWRSGVVEVWCGG